MISFLAGESQAGICLRDMPRLAFPARFLLALLQAPVDEYSRGEHDDNKSEQDGK
jgi:hypothetical protein